MSVEPSKEYAPTKAYAAAGTDLGTFQSPFLAKAREEEAAIQAAKATAVAVHIHVGANIPGYLPESDVTCFDSIEGAMDALRHAIKDQQDFYGENFADVEDENDPWHEVWSDCEADLASIADGEMAYQLGRSCYVGVQYTPPEGPDIIHWMTEVRGGRDECEIFADQDA